MNRDDRKINARDVIRALDQNSDTFAVVQAMSEALETVAVKYVKCKLLALVAVIGNIIQFWGSL